MNIWLKLEELMSKSVLLDTSFFIRLFKQNDALHQSAFNYYKYFLENQFTLKISTISIAEYCVNGKATDLPFKDLQIVPFNYNHALRTGEFSATLFKEKKESAEQLEPRIIIPNDSKLFAQADLDESIQYFVTSDKRSLKTLSMLKTKQNPNFDIIDIHTSYNDTFGVLDL